MIDGINDGVSNRMNIGDSGCASEGYVFNRIRPGNACIKKERRVWNARGGRRKGGRTGLTG